MRKISLIRTGDEEGGIGGGGACWRQGNYKDFSHLTFGFRKFS